MISGFGRDGDEICGLLAYRTASIVLGFVGIWRWKLEVVLKRGQGITT